MDERSDRRKHLEGEEGAGLEAGEELDGEEAIGRAAEEDVRRAGVEDAGDFLVVGNGEKLVGEGGGGGAELFPLAVAVDGGGFLGEKWDPFADAIGGETAEGDGAG